MPGSTTAAGPEFTDIPDDAMRLIMNACPSLRSLVALACSCKRYYALLGDVQALPRAVMTWQCDIEGWLRKRPLLVRELVAKRCLIGEVAWLSAFSNLRHLTVSFCRVRANVLDVLPPRLESLDVHVLQPSGSSRVSFGRFKALRTLHVTFDPRRWDLAFVCRLPRGLRHLSLRGSRGLTIESAIPKGLRTVRMSAALMLLVCNRLPNVVRSVELRCTEGRVWLRDVLPLRPRKLQHLAVQSSWLPSAMPALAAMSRLRSLHLHADSLGVRWAACAHLRRLEHLELHARHWITVADPELARHGVRVVATVNHASVAHLLRHPQQQLLITGA